RNNTTGSNNIAIGYRAGFSSGNLINATAIGANALATQSNTLILGNNANVGIGTSTPNATLDVLNSSQLNTINIENSFNSASNTSALEVNNIGGGSGLKYGINLNVSGSGGSTNVGVRTNVGNANTSNTAVQGIASGSGT